MTDLPNLDPATIARRLKDGSLTLIDIRETDEHAREHVPGSVSLPLSGLKEGHLSVRAAGDVAFHCKSGMRTSMNCGELSRHVSGPAYIMEGGLEAWKKAGLPVNRDKAAPLELNRQVQITAGLLILTGALLSVILHPAFIGLPAFVGAGLTFAGFTGWCGMGLLLARAPWNRRPA